MDNNTKVLFNTVLKSLNTINYASLKTAQKWDKKSKSLPITLFSQIIQKSKWKLHPTNQTANSYINNYNKMIDLLETSAIKSANSFNSKSISLNYISQSIKTLKDAFTEGAKEK